MRLPNAPDSESFVRMAPDQGGSFGWLRRLFRQETQAVVVPPQREKPLNIKIMLELHGGHRTKRELADAFGLSDDDSGLEAAIRRQMECGAIVLASRTEELVMKDGVKRTIEIQGYQLTDSGRTAVNNLMRIAQQQQ